MKHEEQEVNYLGLAQPIEDPRSFRQLVREAFALEYQTTKDGQIAEIVGRDKSRVSQVLKHPEGVEAATIKHLVSFLKSPRHRDRIIAAWSTVYFADNTASATRGYIGTHATERTRRRIDRLIREGQLPIAAQVAVEAVNKTDDRVLQEEFLDRAYFAYQRLDLPGQAMKVVRIIASRARIRGDKPRELGAILYRIRILTSLPDTKPEEVFPVLDQAESLLGEPAAAIPNGYLVGTRQSLNRSREVASVTFMERGLMPIDVDLARSIIARTLKGLRRATSYQARSRSFLMAARCHLLLGEYFQAEELLERSFKEGTLKRLSAFEGASLLMSRIHAHRISPESQSDYLQEVSNNCAHANDRYHRRVAEWDLARVEAKRCPPLMPDQNPS